MPKTKVMVSRGLSLLSFCVIIFSAIAIFSLGSFLLYFVRVISGTTALAASCVYTFVILLCSATFVIDWEFALASLEARRSRR